MIYHVVIVVLLFLVLTALNCLAVV